MRPSTLLLEQTLFTFLNSRPVLTNLATISATHPVNKASFSSKGMVVLNYLNDVAEGTIISTSGAAPSYQLVCYGTTYANCRRLQETVSDVLDSWTASDMTMAGQMITSSYRLNTVAANYEPDTGLWMGSLDYRFWLTTL